MPTTVRIAVLSILLALFSNLILIGFIQFRTHEDAIGELQLRVAQESDLLAALDASSGRGAATAAIADTLRDDPEMVLALVGDDGRVIAGNLRVPKTMFASDARPVRGFEVGRFDIGGGDAVEVGYVVDRLGRGGWLFSGRVAGDRLALQRTLERSLLLALVLSIALGIVCGALIARYVGRRVQAIARVCDDVGDGDLSSRAPVLDRGPGDSFDVLSVRINRMLDRIAALMAELRILTDSLAHDLRSPVSRLRARIEQAITMQNEAQRNALLSGVLDEADALTRMLTTVLEIGRSESMTGRRRFTPVDPVLLIQELAEMYEPLAEEAGVTLSVEGAPSLQPIAAHRQLLAQAISNLIDNALTHGASGGVVSLSLRRTDEALHITVADRGAGIADGDRAEARRRFGRLDASRSRPGAGLGLALVEAVAHLHGGQLDLGNASRACARLSWCHWLTADRLTAQVRTPNCRLSRR